MWNRFYLAVMTILCLGIFPVEASAALSVVSAQSSTASVVAYWVKDEPSKERATKLAMERCKQGRKKNAHTSACKLVFSADGPVYLAFFSTKESGDMGVAFNGDRQKAIDEAYAACTKFGECPHEADNVVFDEGQINKGNVLVNNLQQVKNCQPPAGKVLRYHDNCFNGACTRTFENGCTRQFQAPYCFDPIQQKWDWKPNGC